MKDCEKILLAFFLKAFYNLPTTKGLIENLNTNPSLRKLCGWEYRGNGSSEAAFSRTFEVFVDKRIPNTIHAIIVKENYTDKLVGHASINSTAIVGRERVCHNY